VNPLGLVVNSGVLDTQVVYDMGAVGTTSSSNNRLISGTGGTITNTTLTNRSLVLGSREDATSYSATYQGNIAGTLSVVMGSADRKTNTYRQTFTGSNTYTQNTLVRAGTLIINGGHTGAGNYAVNGKTFDTVVGQEGAADGILGGNGAISLASASNTFRVENTSTTGSRGVLYPGGDNSDTGTLTVTLANTNGLTLGDNSVLRLDIGSGSASDKLAINGSFSLTGTSNTLDLLSLTGAWDGSTYTIVTWTGAFNGGTFDTISGLGSGYTVNYLANSITLSIPEPSTVLLLIGSLAAIGLTHRRFSRRQ
jgi:autotransporter-associated beta strand protein